MVTPKTAKLLTYEDYWKARGDRAIAASLIHRGALLVLRRESLRLRQETLRILATHLDKSDTESVHRLGTRAVQYYRSHGRLLRLAKRFGERLDIHSTNFRKLA